MNDCWVKIKAHGERVDDKVMGFFDATTNGRDLFLTMIATDAKKEKDFAKWEEANTGLRSVSSRGRICDGEITLVCYCT